MTPHEVFAAMHGATHAYRINQGPTHEPVVYYGYYNGKRDDGRPVFRIVCYSDRSGIRREAFKMYFETDRPDVRPLPLLEQAP